MFNEEGITREGLLDMIKEERLELLVILSVFTEWVDFAVVCGGIINVVDDFGGVSFFYGKWLGFWFLS